MFIQSISDRAAIGLSAACLLHCLALPIVLALAPSLSLASFTDETFHLMLLAGIVPVSLIALILGFMHHRRYSVFIMSLIGLSILVGTGTIGHDFLGRTGEMLFTALGSLIIAFGHFKNAKLRLISHS